MYAQNAERVGLTALPELTRVTPARADEAERLAAELEASRISADSWAGALAAEYRADKAIRTAGLLAEATRREQLEFAGICRQSQRIDGLAAKKRVWAAVLRGNAVGVFVNEVSPRPRVRNQRRCHLDALNSLAQVAIALRVHWDERGTLPESLDGDPFGGRPLRYDPRARTVHWIGSDFEDGTGRPPQPGETERELVAREELEPTVSVDFE